jgi:enoyl-CoA hydratase
VSEQPIHVALGSGVATVTIDRPQHRNALSDQVLRELVGRLTELDDEADVRCIVVLGSDKVFASGADIRALLERADIYDSDRGRLWEQLRVIRTPMVAAVSGYCLGGGCELAMMADVVVASETARFGLPETQLGLIPGAGGTQMLPRAIGKAKAMDMILTGRLITAEEAERAGLISRVVTADVWREAAVEVAVKIAGRPPIAQRLAKESVEQSFETGLRAGLTSERRAFAVAFASDDAREGLSAFVEKRSPIWRHQAEQG